MIKEETRSGSGRSERKPWHLMSLLRFLDDVIAPRASHSSLLNTKLNRHGRELERPNTPECIMLEANANLCNISNESSSFYITSPLTSPNINCTPDILTDPLLISPTSNIFQSSYSAIPLVSSNSNPMKTTFTSCKSTTNELKASASPRFPSTITSASVPMVQVPSNSLLSTITPAKTVLDPLPAVLNSANSSTAIPAPHIIQTVRNRKRTHDSTSDDIQNLISAINAPIQIPPQVDVWPVKPAIKHFCKYLGQRMNELPDIECRELERKIFNLLN